MTFIEKDCVKVPVKQVIAALDICVVWNSKENKHINIFKKIFGKCYSSGSWNERHVGNDGQGSYYLLDPEDADRVRKILGPYSNVYLRMWFNELDKG